jgi:tetrahydromethanopterin S-methyltransferase subunit G
MSEDKTLHLPSSFEGRVLAQLEEISIRLAALETRVGKIEAETKPNWERLHSDFTQFHADMKASFGNLDRKLDVVNKEMFQAKADQKGVELRLDKIEAEAHPQIIAQERNF